MPVEINQCTRSVYCRPCTKSARDALLRLQRAAWLPNPAADGHSVCTWKQVQVITCIFGCAVKLSQLQGSDFAPCTTVTGATGIDIQLHAGHGHLIVATATQCCIYSLAHINTPHILDWKETPNLILHADRYLALRQSLHLALYCITVLASLCTKSVAVLFMLVVKWAQRP